MPEPAERAARRRVHDLEQIVADAAATFGRHRTTPQLTGTLDELEATLIEVRSQLADACRTRALAASCEQLNDTETVYPGNGLVRSYSVELHPGTT